MCEARGGSLTKLCGRAWRRLRSREDRVRLKVPITRLDPHQGGFMRIALVSSIASLVVAVVSVALPAAADEPESPATISGTGAAVAPSNGHTLAQVHGGLTADGARVAGRSRDIEMSVVKDAAPKVVRPAPTPRVLRRMSAERVMTTIDPATRA